MNKKYLLMSIVATLIVLVFISISSLNTLNNTEPEAKELLDSRISADEAGRIVLNQYPTGAIKEISLEEEESNFYYQIDLIKDSKEYEVTMDIVSGAILGEREVESNQLTDPILSLPQIEKMAVKELPKAKLIEISLDEEDGFFRYHVEMLENQSLTLIHYDCIHGNIIMKQTIPAESSYPNDLIPWSEAKKIAYNKIPATLLVELELDLDDNQTVYTGILIDQSLKHTLKIDGHSGEIIDYSTETLEKNDYPSTIFQ